MSNIELRNQLYDADSEEEFKKILKEQNGKFIKAAQKVSDTDVFQEESDDMDVSKINVAKFLIRFSCHYCGVQNLSLV